MAEAFSKINGTGLRRVGKALLCSLQGFKAAYLNESAFRQEFWLSVLLFPLSFFIASSVMEWIVLICALLFLLFAELVNSAVEALADSVSLEYQYLLGRAKDMASAAVLLAIIITAIIWVGLGTARLVILFA